MRPGVPAAARDKARATILRASSILKALPPVANGKGFCSSWTCWFAEFGPVRRPASVAFAPYLTGFLKDLTGDYKVPMFVVGGFMLLSAVLMVVLSRRSRVETPAAAEPVIH